VCVDLGHAWLFVVVGARGRRLTTYLFLMESCVLGCELGMGLWVVVRSVVVVGLWVVVTVSAGNHRHQWSTCTPSGWFD
jgi:hypothetical protein